MKRSAAAIPLTDRLAAFSELLRLRICRLLDREELAVGELGKVLQAPQSSVSRHLNTLAKIGLLERRADGAATCYRIDPERAEPEALRLWSAVRAELEEAEDSGALLAADDRRLAAVLAERRTDSLTFFGRVAGEWDRVRVELFGRQFALESLPALLPPEWVVADLGCGTGVTAELLAPYVREVICVDQSTPMLEAARKRLAGVANVAFVQGALEALPLESGSVDAALCLLVLHHVDDPAAGVREVRRVLKGGAGGRGPRSRAGRLLIVDMVEHDRHEYRSTMGHRHLGFAPQRVEAMCRAAGFARVRITMLRSDPDAKGPGLFAAVAD